MRFWDSFYSKEQATPSREQQMTEAQRHNAFVQQLRESAAHDKQQPEAAQQNHEVKSAANAEDGGGRERADDPDAPGSLGRESSLTAENAGEAQGSGHSQADNGNSGHGGQSQSSGHDHGER